MRCKTLLVHLDASARAHARLDIAVNLARRFGAWLTAVYAVHTPDPASFEVMAGSASYYAEHARQRRERHGAIKRLFLAELNRAEIEGTWIDAAQAPGRTVIAHARCADLVIAGQDDPDDPETFIDDHFIDTLLMSAGRPVLLIPRRGDFPGVGRHVMLAWDGSRESARAAHDALPFLQHATRARLVTVNAPAAESPARVPAAADVARQLQRHDIRLELQDLTRAPSMPIGEVLLTHAAETGSDLLVMGAYGHARWREIVLGGVTLTVLDAMTLPVLMSH